MVFKLPDYANMYGAGSYTPFDASLPGIGGGQNMPGGFSLPDYGSGLFPSGSKAGFGDWFSKNQAGIKGVGSGLQSLAGFWATTQALKMAKKNFELQRATTNANLGNQTQSYNTSIEDRARSRGAFEGQSQAQVEDYITKNKLQQRTV